MATEVETQTHPFGAQKDGIQAPRSVDENAVNFYLLRQGFGSRDQPERIRVAIGESLVRLDCRDDRKHDVVDSERRHRRKPDQ